MEQIPWFVWIPIVAILAGVITRAIESITTSRRSAIGVELSGPHQALLADSAATGRALVERLDRIEARLGAIEKTLTDIP